MSSTSEKADYVRVRLGAGHREHHCHWPGCTKQVHPAQWGCRPHWYTLPMALRSAVWRAFKPGQEESQTPSRAYVVVAREVQAWIREHERARELGENSQPKLL